jgi:hypothetical protein
MKRSTGYVLLRLSTSRSESWKKASGFGLWNRIEF